MADAASDPALVLEAYAAYGEQCFERLRGVWGIVVWDERRRRLLISRDRLGVRPLYAYVSGQQSIIASEIKSIIHLDPGTRLVHHRRVRDFVRAGRIDDWTGTLFSRIRPIPPGTVCEIDGGDIKVTHYWTLRPSTDRTLAPSVILEKLVAAVERHTPTDVPVGLSLSGGIDSSSIAGTLSRPSLRETRNIRAFSVTPPHTTDESFLIDATVRHTGLSHTYVPLDTLDYPRSLGQLIDFHDEPVQYSGVLYQFVLRQHMAEAGCRAVLVGYGADEIFSGYDYLAPPFLTSLMAGGRFKDAARFVLGAPGFLQMDAFRIVRSALRHAVIDAKASLMQLIKHTAVHEKLKQWRRSPGPDVLAPMSGDAGDETSAVLATSELDGARQGRAFVRALLQCFRRNIALLVRLEDRNAMAYGLDLCAPFMDKELVEAALSLPFHRFMDGGRNKAVLRDAARELLAPEVRGYERKLNTPGNDAYLAFDVLRPEFLDLFASRSFYASGLWSDRCAELYAADSARRARPDIWFRVYMVQKWYERVIRP